MTMSQNSHMFWSTSAPMLDSSNQQAADTLILNQAQSLIKKSLRMIAKSKLNNNYQILDNSKLVLNYFFLSYFLIAQSVGQGTVAPTHYTILVNSTGLSTDRIQILTYKMCHLYFNWSGTVRIPAVSQYAKKLAFLTGQSLHKPVHEDLRNTLYFL